MTVEDGAGVGAHQAADELARSPDRRPIHHGYDIANDAAGIVGAHQGTDVVHAKDIGVHPIHTDLHVLQGAGVVPEQALEIGGIDDVRIPDHVAQAGERAGERRGLIAQRCPH